MVHTVTYRMACKGVYQVCNNLGGKVLVLIETIIT